jgi:hypothetical protein
MQRLNIVTGVMLSAEVLAEYRGRHTLIRSIKYVFTEIGRLYNCFIIIYQFCHNITNLTWSALNNYWDKNYLAYEYKDI